MSVFVSAKCFARTVDGMMKQRFNVFNDYSMGSVDDWRKVEWIHPFHSFLTVD